jgi:hypothetical protein
MRRAAWLAGGVLGGVSPGVGGERRGHDTPVAVTPKLCECLEGIEQWTAFMH